MRNTLKAATIESKFPLLSVEHDCIISKDADITIAFRVDLPELFTVTGSEYEAIHSAWTKAIKVLPDYSVIHKQDWFVKENYKPATDKENMSFLSRSFERHFNERPFLNHTCFLFLTKTTKDRMRMQSNFSSLCRGNIIPKEVNKETALRFMEAVGQFERILNDSGFIMLTRLTSDEITGTEKEAGLIENTSPSHWKIPLVWRIWSWEQMAYALEIKQYACIPFPMWKICREQSEQICDTKSYLRIGVIAVCPLLHQ